LIEGPASSRPSGELFLILRAGVSSTIVSSGKAVLAMGESGILEVGETGSSTVGCGILIASPSTGLSVNSGSCVRRSTIGDVELC